MTRFLPWILSTLLALFSTFTAYADPVEVKLLLDGSDLGAGKTLYAFDANTNAYLSVSKNTNSSSIATFDLPAGQEVKFRYTFNGKQFFSNPVTSPGTLSSSNPATLNLPAYTDVQLLIGGASAGAGKVIYAFNDAGQYISYSRNTDSSGLSRFTIDPAVNPLVKFRYTYNGRQWFSSVVNTTSQTALVVPTNTDVTLSQTGTPFGANQTLYAFRASTGAYLNYSRKTNASGVASFTLAPEEGPYKFRYTYNGKQWFTDPVPFANPASLDLPPDTYVQTLLGGTPVGANKTIYAFSGSAGGAYLNYSRKTDANGIAKFTLPIDGDDADSDPDSYKFRYTHSGVQHFSPSVPSGASTSISIAVDTKVQLILAGSPAPSGKVVYAFEVTQDAQTGDEILTYTNLSKTTDASGEASFSLGSGSYKFRHDLGGKQWFSSLAAQGGTAILTTPSPTYVSVNIGGNPAGSGKVVYAFNGDGSAYHNYSRNTNSSSVAEFYLEDGEYSFRYDYGGKQWFSDPITVPNTYQAQVLVPVDTTVTVLEAGVPVASKTVYAFDSAGVYQNYTKVTDSNGVASFTLDSGDYKFRYSKSGKDWFSNVVSQGGSAVLTVPAPTYISLNVGGTPGVSKTIYVFGVDHVYHNYSRVTDASGVAQFYLTPGQYLFRYSFGGQDWFTDPVTVTESGASDTLIVPVKTQISLLQAGNPIGSGKTVYAFDENEVYLNYSRVTDANSIAEFSLDAGTYKFRYDFNGRQFFSDLVSVSGSGTASAINLPPDTNVTLSQAGTPLGAGKTIYAFSHSDVYQNYSRVTDSSSVATFTLPISTEPYKFRYDYAARQFFSPSVPSGAAVTLNVANDLVVTVYQGSTPLADTGEVGQTITKTLYLFDESLAYQNYSRNTNASSQATFAIEPAGAYKFRLTLDGYQHFSQTVASTTTAFDFVLPEQTQITFLDGETPIANKTIYVFRPDGTYFNFSRNTDANGVARFTLPLDNQYKFRVDVSGEQYFTPVFAGPGQYSFNIDPSFGLPTLSFISENTSVFESASVVSIPVSLDRTSNQAVTFSVSTDHSTSSDYQLLTETLGIFPGQLTTDIVISIYPDQIDEWDQEVNLFLSSSADALLVSTVHELTIIDDDDLPMLNFARSSQNIYESTGSLNLNIVKSGLTEKSVSFSFFETSRQVGILNIDESQSHLISTSNQTYNTSFLIDNDEIANGNRSTHLTLNNIENANFTFGNQRITIIDDETFSISGLITLDGMPLSESTTIVIISESSNQLVFSTTAFGSFTYAFPTAIGPLGAYFAHIDSDDNLYLTSVRHLTSSTVIDADFTANLTKSTLVGLYNNGEEDLNRRTVSLLDSEFEPFQSTQNIAGSVALFEDVTGHFRVAVNYEDGLLYSPTYLLPGGFIYFSKGDPITIGISDRGTPVTSYPVFLKSSVDETFIVSSFTDSYGQVSFLVQEDLQYVIEVPTENSLLVFNEMHPGSHIELDLAQLVNSRLVLFNEGAPNTNLLTIQIFDDKTSQNLFEVTTSSSIVTLPTDLQGSLRAKLFSGDDVYASKMFTLPATTVVFDIGADIVVFSDSSLIGHQIVLLELSSNQVVSTAEITQAGAFNFPALNFHQYKVGLSNGGFYELSDVLLAGGSINLELFHLDQAFVQIKDKEELLEEFTQFTIIEPIYTNQDLTSLDTILSDELSQVRIKYITSPFTLAYFNDEYWIHSTQLYPNTSNTVFDIGGQTTLSFSRLPRSTYTLTFTDVENNYSFQKQVVQTDSITLEVAKDKIYYATLSDDQSIYRSVAVSDGDSYSFNPANASINVLVSDLAYSATNPLSISVIDSLGNLISTDQIGRKGPFEIGNLPASFRLMISSSDKAFYTNLLESNQMFVNISRFNGSTITVIDNHGLPLRNVSVEVTPLDGQNYSSFVSTNEQGIATLPVTNLGSYKAKIITNNYNEVLDSVQAGNDYSVVIPADSLKVEISYNDQPLTDNAQLWIYKIVDEQIQFLEGPLQLTDSSYSTADLTGSIVFVVGLNGQLTPSQVFLNPQGRISLNISSFNVRVFDKGALQSGEEVTWSFNNFFVQSADTDANGLISINRLPETSGVVEFVRPYGVESQEFNQFTESIDLIGKEYVTLNCTDDPFGETHANITIIDSVTLEPITTQVVELEATSYLTNLPPRFRFSIIYQNRETISPVYNSNSNVDINFYNLIKVSIFDVDSSPLVFQPLQYYPEHAEFDKKSTTTDANGNFSIFAIFGSNYRVITQRPNGVQLSRSLAPGDVVSMFPSTRNVYLTYRGLIPNNTHQQNVCALNLSTEVNICSSVSDSGVVDLQLVDGTYQFSYTLGNTTKQIGLRTISSAEYDLVLEVPEVKMLQILLDDLPVKNHLVRHFLKLPSNAYNLVSSDFTDNQGKFYFISNNPNEDFIEFDSIGSSSSITVFTQFPVNRLVKLVQYYSSTTGTPSDASQGQNDLFNPVELGLIENAQDNVIIFDRDLRPIIMNPSSRPYGSNVNNVLNPGALSFSYFSNLEMQYEIKVYRVFENDKEVKLEGSYVTSILVNSVSGWNEFTWDGMYELQGQRIYLGPGVYKLMFTGEEGGRTLQSFYKSESNQLTPQSVALIKVVY